MSDKIPNLDQIPNVLGYMVLEEEQIITSSGDLENNEKMANLALKIAYTAAKIPVNPDTKDSFKRISTEMKDIIHVKPWCFDQDLRFVIEDELNKKLANKVIYQLGLCVALFDIKKIEDSFVFPGDGSTHTRVLFRYIVFRPFIDEILIGKVKSSSKEGIYITLCFFDDIFIPASNLQKPVKFDEKEQLFIWQYDTGESIHDLYIDIGEEIRFRVVNEVFIDTTPNGPPKKNEFNTITTTSVLQSKEELKSPYTIIGSINESGLGLLSWWKNNMMQVRILRATAVSEFFKMIPKVNYSKNAFNAENYCKNDINNSYYDIIVSGGGMVGAAMALALAQDKLFKNLKIALIDTTAKENDYNIPMFHSNRVCAINDNTIKFFKTILELNAFDFIQQHRYGEVHNIHVWDGSSDAFISFKNDEGSNLALIIENDLILTSLKRNLSKLENLTVIYSNEIKDFTVNDHVVNLTLKDESLISAKLLIGSDGANSFIRRKSDFKITKWDYDQFAIVSTLKLANKQANFTAWQRFLSTGPIALLPLNEEYSSLVWSVKKSKAKELLNLDDKEFVHRVNLAFIQDDYKNEIATRVEKFSQTVLDMMRNSIQSSQSYITDHNSTARILPPKIKSCEQRSFFPLSYLNSNNYVAKRLVLIGDAAHKIHPLAGQGVNLGFGDVIRLHECLSENILSGAEIGSWSYLKKYESERQKETFPKIFGIDILNKIYTDYNYPEILIKTPITILRTIGLTFSNRITPLKNFYIQKAIS